MSSLGPRVKKFERRFAARLGVPDAVACSSGTTAPHPGLDGVSGLTLRTPDPHSDHSYWVFPVLVKPSFGMSRDGLREALARSGIETRGFFVPIHQQPAHRGLFPGESYPVSESIGRCGLYLPSSSALRPLDIAYVTESIRRLARF
jgi:perosamine synthetase